MPLNPAQQAALNRLLTYYDGDAPYDPVNNPGGFRRGGNVPNFEPALKDAATVVQGAGALVQDGQAALASTEAARDQAQAAVASGRVSKPTLAELNAVVANYPEGVTGVAEAGAGAGEYVKRGGAWVYRSATAATLDARTRFIDASFFSADGDIAHFSDFMNRLVLLITQQGHARGVFEDFTGAPYLRDVELGLERVGNADGDFRIWRDILGRVMLVLTGAGHLQGRFETLEGVPYATQADIPAGLVDRLNRGVSTYGLLRDAEVFNPMALRETRKRLDLLDPDLGLGGLLDGVNCQFSMLALGDSWTTSPPYYIQQLTRALVARYGDAGPGYVSFGASATNSLNPNARPDVLAISRAGSWRPSTGDTAYLYGSVPLPGHSAALSGASGDTYRLQYTKPAGGPDISAVKLFAIASNTATAQYRINGGAWIAIDLTGSGFKAIDLGEIPAGSFVLEIQALSADVYLGGALYQTTVKGVVVHKGGASGTRSQQWASGDAAIYQASHAALAPNLIFCLGGTNSQSAYPAETERGYVQTLIDRWKAACPAADICLATSPENSRVNAVRMPDIAEVHRQLAHQNGVTHLNTQGVFGDPNNPASYAFGSARPLTDNTVIHPSTTNGAFALFSVIYRMMRYS